MRVKTIAIILIALGALLMLYTGFNYVTTEKVVDIGPVKINREKNHPVRWSPFIGAALLAGGIIILISSGKNKSI